MFHLLYYINSGGGGDFWASVREQRGDCCDSRGVIIIYNYERSVMRGTKQRDPRGTRHDLGKRLEPKLAHGVGECQHMLAPPLGLGAVRNPRPVPTRVKTGAPLRPAKR